MAAAVVTDLPKRLGRPPRSFEDSVVYDDLRYWGYYKGRQCAADGYSPHNTISELLMGGGGQPGHKILVLDMTPRAWRINAHVYSLPTDYIAVLLGRFCLPVKSNNGQPYTGPEVAEVLGIEVRVYWDRLRAARTAYRRMIFADELSHAKTFATV